MQSWEEIAKAVAWMVAGGGLAAVIREIVIGLTSRRQANRNDAERLSDERLEYERQLGDALEAERRRNSQLQDRIEVLILEVKRLRNGGHLPEEKK